MWPCCLGGCWTVDGQPQRKMTSIINGALITHTHTHTQIDVSAILGTSVDVPIPVVSAAETVKND